MELSKYFKDLSGLLPVIEITSKNGDNIPFDTAILKIVSVIIENHKIGNKVILIGNGGSASIASHIITDFIRSGHIEATTFSDSSLLTCISNDFGYEHVYEKPIEVSAREGDVLFSISSSGKSNNILNAVKSAKKKKCFIITLSGFDDTNPLRKEGDINFYVPSHHYGFVEIIHLTICHLIVDHIKENKERYQLN